MTGIDDRALLEETTTAVTEALACVLSRGWTISPFATLNGTARALAGLAIAVVQQHPEHRDAVLRMLRDTTNCVDAETGTKH
jgi:hypothetical protein